MISYIPPFYMDIPRCCKGGGGGDSVERFFNDISTNFMLHLTLSNSIAPENDRHLNQTGPSLNAQSRDTDVQRPFYSVAIVALLPY